MQWNQTFYFFSIFMIIFSIYFLNLGLDQVLWAKMTQKKLSNFTMKSLNKPNIKVRFFYEFDWLTWLRSRLLTQVKTIITTVFSCQKYVNTFHKLNFCSFQMILNERIDMSFSESTKSDYFLSLTLTIWARCKVRIKGHWKQNR